MTDKTANCSLFRTIQGLQGKWIQSHVFTPQSPGGVPSACQMQYDWPYLDGSLQDGTTLNGHYEDA